MWKGVGCTPTSGSRVRRRRCEVDEGRASLTAEVRRPARPLLIRPVKAYMGGDVLDASCRSRASSGPVGTLDG